MRFYDVDDGTILLDGVDIKKYNLHDLRGAISLVMQEPIIFNYSILENILYGKLQAKNSEIMNVCEISNSLEFIQNKEAIEGNDLEIQQKKAKVLKGKMEDNSDALVALIGKKKYDEEIEILEKLEKRENNANEFKVIEGDVDQREAALLDHDMHEGFKTECGIKGCKLSGGQKQRVAIARTILRKPKILLLDEATSALDEDSQKKVQNALEKAMEGRTSIIIAHRMSTIEKCDKIFVLEDGQVMEEGGFEELKQKGGFFAKLSQGKQE